MTLTSDSVFIVLIVVALLLTTIFSTLLILVTRSKKQALKAQWESENPGQTYDGEGKTNLKENLQESFQKFNSKIQPTFIVLSIVGILTYIQLADWYNRAQDLGTQQGYAPEQPIKFNHKLHAGQYGIQCQYCHTGVEKGKQANIPSANICMNCHNYIKQGPQYGTAEVSKLTEYYAKKQPIKWVRIHNLPDHVYFNHSQHVVAGKIKCQQCHGAVQEMEKVAQSATLEMGWCINCHREMKIDDNNTYYAATFDFVKKHKQMKKEGQKYTVAQMGGLECAKCHY